MKRLIVIFLLTCLMVMQIAGTLYPWRTRSGLLGKALEASHVYFGMGGSYAFFSSIGFWSGQIAQVRVKSHSEKVTFSLEDCLPPAAAMRLFNYHILWSQFSKDPSLMNDFTNNESLIVYNYCGLKTDFEIQRILIKTPKLGIPEDAYSFVVFKANFRPF